MKMAKKSLIIGAMANYEFEQVRPWVKSVSLCRFKGDKVMLVSKCSSLTIDKLVNEGFQVLDVGKNDDVRRLAIREPKLPIHVERFLHIYNYLTETWRDYEYVISTDVKDVVFQTDPAEWLGNNLGIKKIVAGSESLRYRDEPWGDENLRQTYGPFIYELFRNNEIYNVGTLGGTAEYIKDLSLNILLSAMNRPIPIVDQAVFNVLIHTQPFKDATFFAKQSDGWACQAGTTVDPSKITSFRPNLLGAEPHFLDGYAFTSPGEQMFCIVHQYDRVPEWKAAIERRYR
jgi:hypothetical protein